MAVGPSIVWRRTTSAFQFNLVVSTKEQLLLSEERLLASLRWMELKMPKTKSWHPVLVRYIDQIAGRVGGFGGNPGAIQPSPTGDVRPPHGGGGGGGHHHPEGAHHERRMHFSGKVAGLIFDRLGDFEGFVLDTEDGEREFISREAEIKALAERAWRERLRRGRRARRAQTRPLDHGAATARAIRRLRRRGQRRHGVANRRPHSRHPRASSHQGDRSCRPQWNSRTTA
jgi:hypothetical protein